MSEQKKAADLGQIAASEKQKDFTGLFDAVLRHMAEHAEQRVWCVWRYEQKPDGRKDKPPRMARGKFASTTDRATWQMLDAALDIAQRDRMDGIGLMLADGTYGVDLDACISPGGDVAPWATEIVDRLNSYTEISPSGVGLKIVFQADSIAGEKGCNAKWGPGLSIDGATKLHEIAIEGGRESPRYFTITGEVFRPVPVRKVSTSDVLWVRETIERQRAAIKNDRENQAEPAPNIAPILFDEAERKPSQGLLSDFRAAPKGADMSANFHRLVCWAHDEGLDPQQTERLLRQYPQHIPERYHGRLTKMVEACVDKAMPKPQELARVQSAAPLLKPVSVADVLTNPSPPPAFVWHHYLPRGVVALFGAHGGTGKSTIALMLAVATVTGRPLFGVPTEQSPVVFVSLEDGADVVRHRLATICRAWGIDPQAIEALHIVDGTEHPELFAADQRSAGEVTSTYVELTRLVQSTGAGLVVVDNASDSFGGDEINRRQVRAFMRSLGQIARLTDCAVCLLAHVDKGTSRSKRAEGGEGYSGSTAWHNSARSRLFMTRDESGVLTLEHQKSNLGRKCEPIALVWPDDGLPTLATDAPDFSALDEIAQGLANDNAAAALLRMLAEFESREQYASPLTTARNNAHALLRAEPAFKRLNLNRDATVRIVNQCQRAGWIEVLDYRSPDRKQRQRWTVTSKGREFAGLPAPTAPTAPTCHESAQGAEGAGGAPTAPTYEGGMGGERAHMMAQARPALWVQEPMNATA